MKTTCWILLSFAVLISPSSGEDVSSVTPIPRGHAHNDYHQLRPLVDALEHGFCSFEADIYLVDGELLVGHNYIELRPEKTLQKLYLDPLKDRCAKNNGRVYPDGPTVMLLVDIKTDEENVYKKLREVLQGYPEMLSGMNKDRYVQRGVEIVISGGRPVDAIKNDKTRQVGIDGRLTDLDSDFPADLMPLISDRWGSHFRWRGKGPMPTSEREKLHSIVEKAHAAGRRVRFWATPESTDLWQELLSADVDHINTDRLEKLRDFLLSHSIKHKEQ
ncbi:MAG: hypothetical protein HON04_00740 [Planctomicrobium sp.]|nr:hypothetical protein [Planctomicrobium sp.]